MCRLQIPHRSRTGIVTVHSPKNINHFPENGMVKIKFISHLEPTGYGLAGIAYLRGLVNAGVSVQWVPLRRHGWGVAQYRLGSEEPPAILSMAQHDEALIDLPALLEKTSRTGAYDTVLIHAIPEHWPPYLEAGKRNIGYTTWETDRLPVHWPPILNRVERVMVPCTMNEAVFRHSGVNVPIHVIPHIRRHQWNRFTPDERALARR